jgi:RHS repeat-associated protein
VNGNTATNNYNVRITGSGTKSLVYDPNGNLTADGTKTYEWDPLNRLTAINYNGTQRSEFTYNGLNQRVKIVEKDNNGNVVMTRNLVWAGSDILEWRNANNVVQRRLYPQGVQIGTTNYYYTRDHLGSIRELTTSTGTLVSRYDYDPYGRRTAVSGGSISPDFGFAGMYHHNRTSFNLTQYRAYSADFGRWISRDPIAERGGTNVYAYALDNPVNLIDLLGLAPGDSYPSVDAAAIAAMKDIYAPSIQYDREYDGELYKKPDGSYSYTEPKQEGQHGGVAHWLSRLRGLLPQPWRRKWGIR